MFPSICQGANVNRRSAAMVAGIMWTLVGVSLLYRGLTMIGEVAYMAPALAIGYLKGRFVLKKSALRIVNRLKKLDEPVRWIDLYGKANWIVLLIMAGLGMFFRFATGIVPVEVRGFICIAVGTALLQGSTIYYRESHALRS